MDKWIPTPPSLRRDEIFDAVDDREWQKFRLSLKGLPTTIKLDKLHEYLFTDPTITTPHERELRVVRVANYLAALRRGGLLNFNNEVIR